MTNHNLTARLLVLLVLAGALLFSCMKKVPTAPKAPVITHDTVPQITGRYSGWSILDEYDYNSRRRYYVTLNVDSTGDTLNGCSRAFALILDDGSGTSPQIISATGDPWALTWDCSDSMFHTKFTGKADGKSVSGSVFQYRLTGHGDSLFFIVTFSASRP